MVYFTVTAKPLIYCSCCTLGKKCILNFFEWAICIVASTFPIEFPFFCTGKKSISIQKAFSPFLSWNGKPIHQLFCLVDCILMLMQRVKYLFVRLSPFCHSVYPVLVTHFIYLCACLYSCAHVFFIMLFHCHAVSTHSIQRGLLEGLGGTKHVHIAVLFTLASWIA